MFAKCLRSPSPYYFTSDKASSSAFSNTMIWQKFFHPSKRTHNYDFTTINMCKKAFEGLYSKSCDCISENGRAYVTVWTKWVWRTLGLLHLWMQSLRLSTILNLVLRHILIVVKSQMLRQHFGGCFCKSLYNKMTWRLQKVKCEIIRARASEAFTKQSHFLVYFILCLYTI